MGEFDDALGRLLSDPGMMAQISRLAQSLNGPPSGNVPPPEHGPPSGNGPPGPPPDGGGLPEHGPPSGNGPPPEHGPPSGNGPPPGPPTLPGMPGDFLTRLLSALRMMRVPPDSPARQLLYALGPYLRPERREKIERALQLARLYEAGRTLTREWGGGDV